jgi:hypothetical protein
VSLDASRHLVTVGGRPVELTPKEFDLLHERRGALAAELILGRVRPATGRTR